MSTGFTTPGNFQFTPVSIAGGLQLGLNTLDFVVVNELNCPGCTNPTGLRVELTTFDFAVDSLRVDGNIQGSGNPDGVGDFIDNFDDSSVTAFPTSAITCGGDIPSESGGFLNLRSSDGAHVSDVFLVKNCILGLQPVSSSFRLQEGGGDSVIEASFRAVTPLRGQSYGLQLFTVGQNDNVNIQLGDFGSGPRITGVVASPAGTGPAQSVPVDIATVERVIFRLVFNDATNIVTASFSFDGGTTFTTLLYSRQPQVMTTGSTAAASVFGSVIRPQ